MSNRPVRRPTAAIRLLFPLSGMVALLLLLAPAAPRVAAATELPVYSDALTAGWESWSWSTTLNTANTAPVYAGTRSMAATYTAAWAGLYLHTGTLVPGSSYDTLRFRIHGGTASTQLEVKLADAGNAFGAAAAVTAQAGAWRQVDIALAALGNPAQISGIVWQDSSGHAQPTFYLDEVAFVASGSTPTATPSPGSGPALGVNAGAVVRAINPDIYGMNFADEALADELDLPVRRWGGNATTRFNWRLDTGNRASDWYFENIPEDNPNPGALPAGSTTDRFVEQDRRTGTRTILTMPLIGWTPKARAYACGFSVAKYSAQQSTDPWRPDCGNGLRSNGSAITGNDPLDTSAAIDPAFVQDWIAHLRARYGAASQGGVAYYNLDNEPMLWNSTHRDVHPNPTSYDELRDRTFSYAAAIKAADPSAKTLGPVLYGWTAYFWSALDAAPGGSWWNNPQDRNAHGGTPFTAWYLQQMNAYQQQHGTRILDYLDLHNYPQASGVTLAPAGNAATQALRLRSTRSLWDPSYVDESWINEPVQLIPRMRSWVDQNYPGTKLAVTEYNWGGLEHINGALAQADVLGIFGREGLDLATLWDPPTATQPGAHAFRIYRNYDGAGGRFGDGSLAATSADQAQLAIYAARRSTDGSLTVVVINKTAGSLTSALALTGFNPAPLARVYRYSAANLGAIERQADLAVTSTGFSLAYPGASITLIVLPTSVSATATATATPTTTATATRTATATVTRTATATRTATPTATRTATSTATATRTATATATASTAATATRTATPVPAPMHLGALAGIGVMTSSNKWKAAVTVTAHGANHTPLAGVVVKGKWSAGASGSPTCTTDATGRCSVEKTGLSTGTTSVTFTVSGMTRAGYRYQSSGNDVTAKVVVARP